jgi:hypothetical protein
MHMIGQDCEAIILEEEGGEENIDRLPILLVFSLLTFRHFFNWKWQQLLKYFE